MYEEFVFQSAPHITYTDHYQESFVLDYLDGQVDGKNSAVGFTVVVQNNIIFSIRNNTGIAATVTTQND